MTGAALDREPEYLVFAPETGQRYLLYFGNPDAAPPDYDFPHYADRQRAEGVTKASLCPIIGTGNIAPPRHQALPWSERYQSILWLAIAAVFAVLLTILRRQLLLARASENGGKESAKETGSGE